MEKNEIVDNRTKNTEESCRNPLKAL